MSPTTVDAFRCARHGSVHFGLNARSAALVLRAGRLGPRWAVHEFLAGDHRFDGPLRPRGNGTLRLRPVRIVRSRSVIEGDQAWHLVEAVLVNDAGREGPLAEVLIRADRLPSPPARRRPRLRL